MCISKWVTILTLLDYLSPEMIFNLGHDKATDVWSAGVLLYEMVMAVTPFAAKRADNFTELFTNIALVKVYTYTSYIYIIYCMLIYYAYSLLISCHFTLNLPLIPA